MDRPSEATARVLLDGLVVAVLLWLLVPAAALVVAAAGEAPRIVALAADGRLFSDLAASLGFGLAEVALSLPPGLAAAIAVDRLGRHRGDPLFALLLAPVLVPGVAAGLSTAILWGRATSSGDPLLAVLAGSGRDTAFVLVLVLIRLRRFDRRLEAAAIDLGASRLRILRRLLLPHLAPTAGLAAAVVFATGFADHAATALAGAAGPPPGADPLVDAVGATVLVASGLAALAWAHAARRRPATSPRAGAPLTPPPAASSPEGAGSPSR